jgi:hypothetical protein
MSESARTVPTKRHLIPVLLAVALLVAGLAAPALARATTEEVTATMTLADFEVEREWVSGPIGHVRGAAITWGLSGDLEGSVDLVHNNNLNLTTGQGTGFGSMTIATDDVTWEGRYRGRYTDGLFAGTFVVHGSDGTVMRGTVAVTALAPIPVAELDGVILDPHGG